MTNWRDFADLNYLSGDDIELGKKYVVTLEKISYADIFSKADNAKVKKGVLKFKEFTKPMVGKARTLKEMRMSANEKDIEKWIGKKFIIFTVNEKHFGEIWPVIHAEKKPYELPELTPTHEKWNGAKKALKAGQVTIDQIKANYRLTAENEKGLLND